jgi:membrane-associated protease RseP (regulator of RpoE activity)
VRAFFEVDSPVHGGISDAQFDQLTRAQARRDAVMAQHIADALERNPAHVMVVLAGTGHVLYDLGIARQLPPDYGGAAASVMPVPIGADPETVRASVADIVWGIPESPFPRYPELGVVAIGADHGLDIIHVDDDSPAAAAGIRVGDRLRAIDESSLWERSDLSRAMAQFSWGDAVSVTLERDGAKLVVDVALRR